MPLNEKKRRLIASVVAIVVSGQCMTLQGHLGIAAIYTLGALVAFVIGLKYGKENPK